MRIVDHPILPERERGKTVKIYVDGEPLDAIEGEPIAAALMAAGKLVLRYTVKHHEPRGVFCAIGQCTDCMMMVDGMPNIRTCVTLVRAGMQIETQHGLGRWGGERQ